VLHGNHVKDVAQADQAGRHVKRRNPGTERQAGPSTDRTRRTPWAVDSRNDRKLSGVDDNATGNIEYTENSAPISNGLAPSSIAYSEMRTLLP